MFLSRIHRKKGCDLLLEAFARLAAETDLDLVMAGPDEDGLQLALEAQAARLGIAGRVHWTGMLEGDVKWGALRAADAFVLPSHQENFGIAVVEALACGVPVIISDKVNIWPEIAQDKAGIVKEDSAEGTYQGMVEFLAMGPEERLRMIRNGVDCFRVRYEMSDFGGGFECFVLGGLRGLMTTDSVSRRVPWYPTSREKRARYGAPDLLLPVQG